MGEDELRAAMVRSLVRARRIRTPAVEAAFRRVPRHCFLPRYSARDAYRDEAVPIKWQDGITISSASQPSMMAIMLEQLGPLPGHRVLEIGTGTGYNAALMAELVGPTGSVVSVDIDDDLVEGAALHLASAAAETPPSVGGPPGSGAGAVRLVTGDGALGHPDGAPYDRIMLTVGAWDIHPAWWRQLAPGGRLVLPLSVRGSQLSLALDLLPGDPPRLSAGSARGCAFVRLRGTGEVAERVGRLGADGPLLQGLDLDDGELARWRRLLGERPRGELISPVRLGPGDLWDGFGLWLLLRETGAGRLLTGPDDDWPSLDDPGTDGGTLLLHRPDGLALVTPVSRNRSDAERRHPVAVRGYGPGGASVAAELDRLLGQWARDGQPEAEHLHLVAYPAGQGPPAPEGGEVRKTHTRLLVDWPGNPVARAPILDR
jgi:protein-L-isoaspartate(D-aspartate) O-methyltransferase